MSADREALKRLAERVKATAFSSEACCMVADGYLALLSELEDAIEARFDLVREYGKVEAERDELRQQLRDAQWNANQRRNDYEIAAHERSQLREALEACVAVFAHHAVYHPSCRDTLRMARRALGEEASS